jgi:hypothetical protein
MIDLSVECLKTRIGEGSLKLKKGGKSYFEPIYNHQTGQLKMVFGYCDEKPVLEEIDISELFAQ